MFTNNIISLRHAATRREHIQNTFEQHRIAFCFFDALTPSAALEQAIADTLPQLAHATLSDGERACFMSHISLWQSAINNNMPYIGIFEDDILLGENAADFLNHDEWLTQRFNANDAFIIRFETFQMPVWTRTTSIAPHLGRNFEQLRSTHYGTAAYLISQAAARALLQHFKTLNAEQLTAIDIMMFENRLDGVTVYQLNPGLCIQELQYAQQNGKLPSQLEAERSKIFNAAKHRKVKRTFWQQLVRFFNTPIRILKIHRKKRQSTVIPFK